MSTLTEEPNALATAPRHWPKTTIAFGLFAVVLVIALLISLCVGRFAVSVPRTIEVLFGALMHHNLTDAAMDERIVLLVRAPRVLLAAPSGAALATTGVTAGRLPQSARLAGSVWHFPGCGFRRGTGDNARHLGIGLLPGAARFVPVDAATSCCNLRPHEPVARRDLDRHPADTPMEAAAR